MPGGQIVRRAKNYPIRQYGRPQLWSLSVAARNVMRNAMRRYARKKANQLMDWVATSSSSKGKRKATSQGGYFKRRIINGKNRKFWKMSGMASGPTHTTTRMIVRKTPKQQRSLRKYFKSVPLKNMHVNRFGFAWMGPSEASTAKWYSICHLKFNNLTNYMSARIIQPQQSIGQVNAISHYQATHGNSPDSMIYIGKCTFTYELYNPTNYIITVYIYDLICKQDTPWQIQYDNPDDRYNSAPESCMSLGNLTIKGANNDSEPQWIVGDPTVDVAASPSTARWNSVGMKPTDYHYFNTFWKVKGMRKIVLPPTSSHHHVVVYNPKKVFTQASLYYPRHNIASPGYKCGIAGITQATLFGFQGQVAVENDQSTDNTNSIGTLPGKLIINCVKKVNVWNVALRSTAIINDSHLKSRIDEPKIFTDLVEQTATST